MFIHILILKFYFVYTAQNMVKDMLLKYLMLDPKLPQQSANVS